MKTKSDTESRELGLAPERHGHKGRPQGLPTSPDPEQTVVNDEDAERLEQPEAPGNAEGDAEKMKANRERLHVNDEHKTPEMEKGHRGTFP